MEGFVGSFSEALNVVPEFDVTSDNDSIDEEAHFGGFHDDVVPEFDVTSDNDSIDEEAHFGGFHDGSKSPLIPLEHLVLLMCCPLFCLMHLSESILGNIRNQFQTKGPLGRARYVAQWIKDHTRIHLACCLTKKSVYHMYKDENEDIISGSQFFKILKRKLPYIKILIVSRFTICDTCFKISNKMKAAKTKKEKNALIKYRDAHLKQQNLERAKYYKHITKARNNPKKYLSVIIDGMDQAKTNIPHLVKTPKTLSNIWLLKVNLTGAIVHGQGIYGFFDPHKYSHGANYTISILINILSMMTSIPDVLYLQLANCQGANKNRFMLGFLSALVAGGIFKKVKVGFLMVGHTHEDIDQVFSRYSVWLRHNDACTMDALLQGFEQCYTPKPTSMIMNKVYNIDEYLELNTIKHHSRPHLFKLTKEDGQVVVKYKKWSTDKEWLVTKGIPLLKETFELCAEVKEVKPTTERISEKNKNDAQILAKFFKSDSLARWWRQFFEDLNEDVSIDRESYQLISELTSLKILESDEQACCSENAYLEGFDDINAPIPEITIGGTKNRLTETRLVEQKSLSNENVVKSLAKGNVIAVFTNDRNYDFYLLKITKPARNLHKEATGDWGNTFTVGSSVVQGQYYDLMKDSKHDYKLLSAQKCLVYTNAVLQKVADIAPPILKIDHQIHCQLLSAVDLIYST